MNVKFIGAACSLGGKHQGTRNGPDVFKEYALPKLKHQTSTDKNSRDQFDWLTTIHEAPASVNSQDSTMSVIEDYCRRIRDATTEALVQNGFPVVIGGDHSCAIGTWSGVSQVIQKPIGMLWIDAHLDAHTPETSHSGAVHGMPVACLLGHGPDKLVDLGHCVPVFDPDYTCILGARSYESAEPDFLKQQGVRIFSMNEIEQDGFKAVFERALQHVVKAPHGFGISIDLDAIDPKNAPGVTTPADSGFSANELLNSLKTVKLVKSLKALEIAEFNPARDKQNRTCEITTELIKAVFN